MSHSQAARSTAQQSSRPVLHERQLETDEDATDVGNPAELSIVEAARPWLLFKALVDLNDTTEVRCFRGQPLYGRLQCGL